MAEVNHRRFSSQKPPTTPPGTDTNRLALHEFKSAETHQFCLEVNNTELPLQAIYLYHLTEGDQSSSATVRCTPHSRRRAM